MGKRGPQPQPAEIKRLRGNPGKRPISDAPKALPGVPRCPDDLKHLADSWNHYGKTLAGLGVLRETDGIAWEMLWRTFDKYIAASKEAKIGRIKSPTGVVGVDPMIITEGKYLNNLLRLLDHFGMSPTSRSAISVEAPRDEDEFSKFLKQRKTAT